VLSVPQFVGCSHRVALVLWEKIQDWVRKTWEMIVIIFINLLSFVGVGVCANGKAWNIGKRARLFILILAQMSHLAWHQWMNENQTWRYL
jgi:hypothetical protein